MRKLRLQNGITAANRRQAACKQIDALALGEAYGEALANLLAGIDRASGEAAEDK